MTDEPPLRRRAAESRTGDEPHDAPSATLEPAGAGPEPTGGAPVPLTAPREGTPQPVAAEAELAEVVARFAAGTGPVALDAERASGYRYSQRAYLVQLRRAGAGTVLIDPLPLPDLSALDAAIADAEWVLHAASQDLPCLTELGLRPRRLFDTELAARLAGFERVGLAALTEQLLGFSLEKHHSAADWSSRPLPESWLTYAALDVELLVDLRDALDEELTRQGKSAWAAEEFAALIRAGARPPRVRAEPWRRTSGIHRVRGARAQARVRSLWYARDQIAARRDAAPGRVLPDSAIVAAAELDPRDEKTLLTLPGFGGRSVRRLARTWLAALDDARQLPDDALPVAPVVEGPPPPHRWAERDPVAAGRLARCREVVIRIAGAHTLPPENLIAPDSIRRLAWTPPDEVTEDTVAETLRGHGAREWQLTLLVPDLTPALGEPATGS
ncbi:ribonuclease D [Micromonospora olivasterospora]|uniref:Ribonuclease D n=1 Tax=Micromonospora olivasterospora TaxID=1880 RepID=A0A562IEA3_MICOL|nr:ribonuclease D [Micromonospora olivasterospora]TWH69065.1 ribonuclease D [Micromonospora olivasterospora]